MQEIEKKLALIQNFIDNDEENEMIDVEYELVEYLEENLYSTNILNRLFKFIEHNNLAFLGMPGPIVHYIESITDYEKELLKSIKRQPSLTTLTMLNRILNSDVDIDTKNEYKILLDEIVKKELNEEIKDEVQDIISNHFEE
jgi:hypothetical protein